MMDEQANKPIPEDTQRRGWSPAERALLLKIAGASPPKNELAALFPGRTLGAVKVKLYHIRRELELPKQRGHKHNTASLKPTPQGPRMLAKDEKGQTDDWLVGWRQKATEANASYLAAVSAATA